MSKAECHSTASNIQLYVKEGKVAAPKMDGKVKSGSPVQSKQDADEERLHTREEEMEALKTARAETSRLRSEYAKRRLEMKEFHDEQYRGVLRERTNEKTARGALRESQRQGLMDEMARLRKAAAVQESWLKVSILIA